MIKLKSCCYHNIQSSKLHPMVDCNTIPYKAIHLEPVDAFQSGYKSVHDVPLDYSLWSKFYKFHCRCFSQMTVESPGRTANFKYKHNMVSKNTLACLALTKQ